MELVSAGASQNMLMEFPIHTHGYWEILMNLSGTGEMCIDGKKFLFQENDIFIIPPNVPHGKTSSQGFEDLSIMLKDMRPIGGLEPKQLHDDSMHTIRTLMKMCLHFFQNQDAFDTSRTPALLNALGESIYATLVVFFHSGRTKDLRIEGLIDCMEANFSNPDFDLSREIEKLGYCKGYFRKVFKDATGQSPVNYFNELRIGQAKRIMQHYGYSRSVKDIAADCGFRDPYYFSRMFKKITGQSPRDYLKQLGTFDPAEVDRDHLI